jgi:hypothetical protein
MKLVGYRYVSDIEPSGVSVSFIRIYFCYHSYKHMEFINMNLHPQLNFQNFSDVVELCSMLFSGVI